MKDKTLLLNKFVTLYLDGAWELSGKIADVSESSMVVRNKSGSYLVFRSKVCGILFSEEKSGAESVGVMANRAGEEASTFPSNEIGYESSMHIPLDLLGKDGRREMEEAIEDNNLSVYFASSSNEDEEK